MQTPTTDSPQRRAGFTLMELMVALTIGGIAITSIYAIGAATTRNFVQQQQVAGTQSSLRMAINRVKRDIARAGYLSTPNISVTDGNTGLLLEACGPETGGIDNQSSDGKLAGIAQFINDTPVTTLTDGIDPTGANAGNGFTHDEIRLIANYETSDQYPGIRRPEGDDDSVLLPQDWHAYKRDFTRWYEDNTNDTNDAAFDEAFTVGRMVRILTTRRRKHFAVITDVTKPGEAPQSTTDPAIIDFDPPIPPDCLGEVDGGWIAPVSVIRYFVQNAPVGSEGIANTGKMAQLLRQETLPTNKGSALAANAANTRAILDFVVSFNLRFLLSDPTAEGLPDAYNPGDFLSDAAAVTAVNANPERVRAVEITLAARTALSDPRYQQEWDPNNCSGMRCFQVFPDDQNQGAARVRRTRAQVFIPNIAYEGY